MIVYHDVGYYNICLVRVIFSDPRTLGQEFSGFIKDIYNIYRVVQIKVYEVI
jgi:hypothetical protein